MLYYWVIVNRSHLTYHRPLFSKMSSLESLCKNNITNRLYLLSGLKNWPCRKSNRTMIRKSSSTSPTSLFLFRLNSNSYFWGMQSEASSLVYQVNRSTSKSTLKDLEPTWERVLLILCLLTLKCCMEPRNEARLSALAVQLVNLQNWFQERRYVGFSRHGPWLVLAGGLKPELPSPIHGSLHASLVS